MQNIRLRSLIRNLNFAADPAFRAKPRSCCATRRLAAVTPPLRFTAAAMTSC